MKRNKLLAMTLLLLSFVSCSGFKKMATDQMGSFIFESSNELLTEKDWEIFEKTIDSNTKLIENLYSADRENKELLVTLIKAYTGKAFAINETYLLKDQILEIEDSIHQKEALKNYSKALSYGAQFLLLSGLQNANFAKFISSPESLSKLIDEKLSDSQVDVEGVFYTAQALVALINLQRTNMRAIAYLPVAKSMYDWACGMKPDIASGGCDIFYATYEASRPKMLGGNPAKGKVKFLETIKKWPDNLLVRQSFIQYYAIPMLDEDDYYTQKREINKYARLNLKPEIWTGGEIRTPRTNYNNLFNMIAFKRLQIIEKLEKEIF